MNNYLKSYSANKYSQFGEDGILEKIFELLPKSDACWCVEFGAWDGKYLSNTYELIANKNWNGVLIEGNPKKFTELKQTFQQINRVILLSTYVALEGKDSLDQILKKTPIPIEFDFLSIDIDGNDYHVWDSLKTYSPRLVVIEFNPSIPGDIEFIQEKNNSINHGNSLLSLVKLGKSKGYELIATTYCNGFFVKKEFFHLFKIKDNSIDSLWENPEAPRIFQLYDGTLMLTKEFNLTWNHKHIGHQDIQVIPKFLRHFGDTLHSKNWLRKISLSFYLKLTAKNKIKKIRQLISTSRIGRIFSKLIFTRI